MSPPLTHISSSCFAHLTGVHVWGQLEAPTAITVAGVAARGIDAGLLTAALLTLIHICGQTWGGESHMCQTSQVSMMVRVGDVQPRNHVPAPYTTHTPGPAAAQAPSATRVMEELQCPACEKGMVADPLPGHLSWVP